jgi:uncharacterized protein YbaP (TraB family)
MHKPKKMRQLLFIVLITCISLFSCKSKSREIYFWKVSKNDVSKVSYLYGTMHLIEKDKYQIPNVVLETLDKVDILYLELNPYSEYIEDEGAEIENSEFIELSSYPCFSKAEQYIRDSLKLSIEVLQITNLFKIERLFMVHLLKEYKLTSIERELVMNVGKDRISGFESKEEHIKIMREFSGKDMDFETLLNNIVKRDSVKEELLRMFNCYYKGTLEDELKKEENIYLAENDYLLKNRNINWLEKIEAEFNDKSMFIAVGCFHMFGEYGLINLLKERGFKVEKIKVYA